MIEKIKIHHLQQRHYSTSMTDIFYLFTLLFVSQFLWIPQEGRESWWVSVSVLHKCSVHKLNPEFEVGESWVEFYYTYITNCELQVHITLARALRF